jgi:transposase InsO family protein
MRYYYSNLLTNQNITSRTNIVWGADITEIEIDQKKKFYVYLCIDIHSNKIIATTSSKKTITSQAIVKCLKKTIEKRFKILPATKVILHTDRGTQFTSKTYHNFINQFKDILDPSMSRENTPTDNAVAERFMRTFKDHEIEGKTFEQSVQESVLLGSKSYRSIVNLFVKSLNRKPNKKSLLKAAEKHDKSVTIASMFMVDAKYPKAFSERFGEDSRRKEIYKYKLENSKVTSVLEELAAKRAEIVDETPFDNFDDNLALKLIDQRLTELYELLYSNPLVIKQYVEDALQPLDESVSSVD